MERKKIVKTITLHFVIIHLLTSGIVLLSTQLGHPLFRYIKGTPIGVQVSILALIDIASYVIIGYIYGRFYPDKKRLNLIVERPVIVLFLLLLTVFSLIYYLSQVFYQPNIMLIYIFLNPWYGTYMWRLDPESLYSLWWILSTMAPSIGYYIGIKTAIKHHEGVEE